MLVQLLSLLLSVSLAGSLHADVLKDAQNLLGKGVSCEPIEKDFLAWLDAQPGKR